MKKFLLLFILSFIFTCHPVSLTVHASESFVGPMPQFSALEENEASDGSLSAASSSLWSEADENVMMDSSETAAGFSPIVGYSVATAEQMQAYLLSVNPSVSQSVLDMIPYYLSEGKEEGIRGDIAFAQSCLETGNFNFEGSAVTLDQNNFCGMGVTDNGMEGNSFSTPQHGIRAQIQHLKAYCSTEPLNNECVDPRFDYVPRASAVYVEWLGIQENPDHAGWASGSDYGAKILAILDKILQM